jgi:hypothetical protein
MLATEFVNTFDERVARQNPSNLTRLPLGRSNRTAVLSRMAVLTWSIIKTPALTSEISFHFGLSIDGKETTLHTAKHNSTNERTIGTIELS